MGTPVRRLRDFFRRRPFPPRKFPSTGFKVLDHVHRLEEENWDWYTPDAFYPAQIGEVLRSRYQVLGKLGYGAHSTVWLCRDLPAHKYVTLKICERNSLSARREAAAYEHLNGVTTTHSGALLIRQLLDSFQIKRAGGVHQSFVHEPLGMSIETLRQLVPGKRLFVDLLKAVVSHLLLALDCLHSEAKMVHTGDWSCTLQNFLDCRLEHFHTDIQARNIHLRIEDESILDDFERGEMHHPSARKVDGERVIYESRGFRMPKKSGRPVLCDFGEARYGQTSFSDDIQPYVYRAPEVILDLPWAYEVDIWNVGVLIWDLFENKHLFTARDENGNQSIEYHLAEMIAILGPPPVEYLQRSKTSASYFDAEGNWKASAKIPRISLEKLEERLFGEGKVLFLGFLRKMLQWAPEQRHTAKQLLEDPWLKL